MFQLSNPVSLYFGSGSFEKLGQSVIGLGSKALIVTGKTSARKHGILQKAIDLLADNDIECVAFERVTPNPASLTVDEGVRIAREQGCGFVIGIGGGSAMDTAKAIAVCAVNEGRITDYQPGGKYADKPPEKALPIVTVTTTAGTGSEYNRYLVITNVDTNEKPGIGFNCTYPTVSIVDPQLMLTLPKDITIDTGVDVLFHALEAFVGKDANMYTDLIASEAIQLTVNYLETAIKDGKNIEARSKMAWANTLAGQAIDIAGTVAIHAAGHPLSGHFDLTHAQTLAALGVTYLRQNYQANPEKFAILTKLLGYKGEEFTIEELAEKAPQALKDFLQRVNRDVSITELADVRETDIKKLTEDTFKTMEGAVLNNPRPLNTKDIENLYRESL